MYSYGRISSWRSNDLRLSFIWICQFVNYSWISSNKITISSIKQWAWLFLNTKLEGSQIEWVRGILLGIRLMICHFKDNLILLFYILLLLWEPFINFLFNLIKLWLSTLVLIFIFRLVQILNFDVWFYYALIWS